MKKLILLSLLAVLVSCKCFVAGEMSEERKRIYELGNEKDYCKKNPTRCINDVPW